MLTPPGSEPQRDFLEKAFLSAATLASTGANYLESEGLNPHADEVFKYLFGTEHLGLKRVAVRLDLRGVSDNAKPVQDRQPKGERGVRSDTDVLVFCTLKRLEEGTAPDGSKRFFDSVIKQFLKVKNKIDCTTAFAWTIISNQETDPDKPDIMQICPWFLDYGMNQDAQFQGQFKPGILATMIDKWNLDKKVTKLVYTPIDLFQLFDKVIVHELSHTRRGGKSTDIRDFDGYGWKNCHKIATQTSIGPDPPNKNADSIALFASISGMMSADKTLKVTEDGKVERNAGGATKRSSLSPDENGKPARVPAVVKRRALQFDALRLKGRSLF